MFRISAAGFANCLVLLFCLLGTGVAGAAEPHFEVTAFEVTGENPLDAERTREILASRVGDRTLKELLAAAKSLEGVIRKEGHAFHRVILPPQTLKDGTVRLEVVAFRLGAIEVPSDPYFGEANLLGSLPPLRKGESVDLKELSRSLNLANRHAFKDVDVVFRQSPQPRRIDASLTARTRDPSNLYAVLNNGGSEETGRSRLSLIYQDANFAGRDHELTASVTTSPENVSDVLQLGLSYGLPFYTWHSRLEGFAVYSNVDSGRVADFDVAGAGTLYGLTWVYVPAGSQHYHHELRLGVTDKRFDNDVQFQGTQLGTDVRSRPLGLEYAGEWKGGPGELSFNIQWSHNLPGGDGNDQADYSANRAGAPRDWQALRVHARGERALGKRWLLRGRVEAQFSADPLISGEQIGIGGAYTVRGYEERELAGDSGYSAAVELWLPDLWSGLSPYGFFDLGSRRLKNAQAGEEATKSLRSVGLGVDWRGLEGLMVKADVAYALDDGVETEQGDLGLHFNLIYRF